MSTQGSNEASYVATMKTIRQVKTVFIIFISFVSCWSPYIVVLLFDSSDSLPLPVHLYASMLAHLHASLNFAIYGLMNRNLRSGFAAHLLACRHGTACNDISASATGTVAAYGSYNVQRALNGRGTECTRAVDVNRSLAPVECHQLIEVNDRRDRNIRHCWAHLSS